MNTDVDSIVDVIVRKCASLPDDERWAFIASHSRNLLIDGLPHETILEIERQAKQRLGIKK